MSIRLQRVSRVVIAGEWFSVELGTFEVMDMEFVDESGAATHEPIGTKAYRFQTPNKDIYYGPLSAITLIKLLDI
jgi:hypothetical protein